MNFVQSSTRGTSSEPGLLYMHADVL